MPAARIKREFVIELETVADDQNLSLRVLTQDVCPMAIIEQNLGLRQDFEFGYSDLVGYKLDLGQLINPFEAWVGSAALNNDLAGLVVILVLRIKSTK